MANAAKETKDTIYVDVDDEITGIIDKVDTSKHKIVALVLPKRATVLQSIVNMKLLKRHADQSGKRIVLITSEAGLLPLAGAVGLHTAKTLQSKPGVPPPPDVPDDAEPALEAGEDGAETDIDASKSVGELAGMPDGTEEETIDVGDEEPAEDEPKDKKTAKDKKDSKIKIPNFDSFRLRLFLGIGGFILLIILWFIGFKVMPKASIVVTADTSTVNIDPSFTVDTAVKEVDTATGVVPGELKQYAKTDSTQVAATGQKDAGTKASGSVTLSNCTNGAVTIPSGSGVSASGLTFITQQPLSLDSGNFDSHGNCKSSGNHIGSVNILAQNNGDKYNIGSHQTFSVAGYPGVSGSNGAAISGGTSNIVKVVAQSDIDGAKQKLIDKNNEEAKKKLFDDFQKANEQGITETFSSGTPAITSTPNVGDQADNVTVNAAITYTMLGAKKDDLKKIIETEVKKQVDTNKQPIQDYGLASLTFQLGEAKSPNQVKVTMATTVTAGVKLDIDSIKKQIAGKKSGDVKQIIGSQTGVKDVTVHYSPFWVSKTPGKPGKITITLVQSSP